MDKNSLELFQFGSEAFRREVVPVYEQARRDFMAHLMIENTTLADLIEQDNQAIQNALLVRRFVGALPAPTNNKGSTFKLHSETQLHGVISSVIWQYEMKWSAYGRKYLEPTPHYVVGVASPDKYLVARADNSDLAVLNTVKGEGAIIKETLYNAARPLAASVIKKAFCQKDHSLVIEGRVWPSSINKKSNRFLGLSPKTHLSDSEVAEFDVLSRLNILATLFDKKQELDDLVANYGRLTEEIVNQEQL